MSKQNKRWYEQNDYLKAFMNLLEDLDITCQCEIAVDIIVKASSFIDRDYKKMIQEVSSYNPNDFKRWYDKNPNVHLAIEALRDLDEKQREEIIKEFTDKILNNHYLSIEEEDEES